MKNSKLRIALVGCGGISRRHLAGYNNMKDIVEIVAFCDIIEDHAKRNVSMYSNPDAPIYLDYKKLIEDKDVLALDAFDICTPNNYHSIIAVAALNAGLNVFCEKPDAVSVEEVLKMKEASETSGKMLMVMRNNRYWLTSAFLKQFIADGKMGEIYAGRCGWIRRRGIPGYGGWFCNKEESGGGPLIDLGVHMIDLAMWLMGNPEPITVSACTYNKFGGDAAQPGSVYYGRKGHYNVEDLAMGFIRFENGACLQIEFSWASNIPSDRFYVELMGTKAGSKWDSIDQKLKIFTEENGVTVDYCPNIQNDKGVQMHEANLRHFADCLLNGTEPMFVPQQGVNMVKILRAIYQSAEEGREIRL